MVEQNAMAQEGSKNKNVKVAEVAGRTGLNTLVFCSANDLPEKYTAPAEELARLIAANGHTMVWGGSDKGLMKIMASGAQEGGAKIIGVSTDAYAHLARENADEMIIAKTLGERKATMMERSDVVCILVGGIGTLDETTELIELKRQGHHDKPIVVLNTDGFYEGLHTQFQRMEAEGMLTRPLDELVYFADTASEVMTYIEQFKAT